MDKKELIIIGIVVILAIVIGSILFAPSDEAKTTSITLLNKGDLGENSTVYLKLKDIEENSLSGKTIHVKITNSKNKVIYNEDVETHATGVAMAPLKNMSAGNYTLEVSFDGDENYTASSLSKKITIKGEEVEEDIDESELVDQTIDEAQNTQTSSSQQSSYSQPRYSQSSYSQSSSSSSSSNDDGSMHYYDENGNEALPEYDENGNEE